MRPTSFSPFRSTLALATAVLMSACSMVGSPAPGGPARTAPAMPTTPPAPDRGPPPSVGTGGPPPRTLALDRLPEEVRALWVVRTTLTHPDSIRVMVERADRAGFNTLIVQVRGRGDAYYRSRWEPQAEGIRQQGVSFDPLYTVIREAHARGMGVHAWVNTHLIGGTGGLPSDPAHLISGRPDLLAVPRELARELFRLDPFNPRFAEALLAYAQANTDRIEGLYSAPSHPEVQEHIYAVWMDLLETYDLDGLHFDYIRYPSLDFDYSRGALERFRAWVAPRLPPARLQELDDQYRQDPLAFAEALPGPWGEFRRAQITGLVERIYFGVKKRNPSTLVSAAVFADPDDAFENRFQDWRGWIQAGFLDVVAPMAYTPDNDLFEDQIRVAVEAAGPDRVWAGIGVYRNTYQGTLDKVRIARSLGTRGTVLFSYDWAVSEGESDGEQSFLDRVGAELFRRR